MYISTIEPSSPIYPLRAYIYFIYSPQLSAPIPRSSLPRLLQSRRRHLPKPLIIYTHSPPYNINPGRDYARRAHPRHTHRHTDTETSSYNAPQENTQRPRALAGGSQVCVVFFALARGHRNARIAGGIMQVWRSPRGALPTAPGSTFFFSSARSLSLSLSLCVRELQGESGRAG